MLTPASPAALRLDHAGQALRQQLVQLEARHQPPASAPPLAGLLAAFDDYERAVLACLPPARAWPATPHPTPTELLAEREQAPLYRLGWGRGYQAGQQAAQGPAPIDPAMLMQQVRRLLAQLQERYGAGPLTQGQYTPSLTHFRNYAPY